MYLGPLPVSNRKTQNGMDALVLMDAIAACMAYEEKELCKTGHLAMSFVVETAAVVMGSKFRVRCSELITLHSVDDNTMYMYIYTGM